VKYTPICAPVVLNYRSAGDTLSALSALRYSRELDLLPIVVDNTTADDPAHEDLASRVGPGVEVVATGDNLGYAGGNNVGIRLALDRRTEFVLLLNPDTVVHPDTISGLLAAAESVPDAAILGPRVLRPDGRIASDGGTVDPARSGAVSHLNEGATPASVAPAIPYDVDYVTGCCLLLRSSAIEDAGLLPEEWFLYFEETDFCLRVQEAGWRTVVDPSVGVTHHRRSIGQAPSVAYVYYMTRNRLHFGQRWFGASLEAVLDDHDRTFLTPWRARIERAVPAWLPVFTEVVNTAVSHAAAGRTGRYDGLARFPEAPASSSAGARP
jgi:GT2 family glycosyltransferase